MNKKYTFFWSGPFSNWDESPFERIWGIGYDAKNAMKNIDSWGENRLGKILNQVIIELGL